MRTPRGLVLSVICVATAVLASGAGVGPTVGLFPSSGAKTVNPDTHLVLTFASEPTIGTSGQIRIYDAADDRLVDTLDLSIPAGPTEPNRAPAPYSPTPYDYTRPSPYPTNANTKPGTPSGAAAATKSDYQLSIIGGFTDGFHFYPVIVHGNAATIYPHNNLLEYGHTYYVQVDPGVFTLPDGSFLVIAGKAGWTFSTKASPPPATKSRLVVSADGTGDFNTVQGAVDSIPDENPRRVTIFIRNGTYEEIVYFRNKANITFIGEDREKAIICYRNNEVFNPHPVDVATNEWPGTFPSRRAAFTADNSHDLAFVNLTIRSINEKPAQAEGLLVMGQRNLFSNVTIEGSGDALQANGSVYFVDSKLVGYGDNILGRGPGYYERMEMVTMGGPHMWIRNTEANHGNVFVDSTFRTIGDRLALIARAPTNHGRDYPFAEAILIDCKISGISPEGWGAVGPDTMNLHYWEINSTNLADGSPADVSQRAPWSRRLNTMDNAGIISMYRDPAFVLGGWKPAMAPVIVREPQDASTSLGGSVTLSIEAVGVPSPTYEWSVNGSQAAITSEPRWTLEKARVWDAGDYGVIVSNSAGTAISLSASLKVE